MIAADSVKTAQTGSCQLCGTSGPTSSEPAAKRLKCCVKCKGAGRQVLYCTRECQVEDYKVHKRICGVAPSPAPEPFQPSPRLLLHREVLASTASESDPHSFIHFPPMRPKSDTDCCAPPAPDPIPIILSEPSRPLFRILCDTAFETGNHLAVNLMYALLVDAVEAQGGTHESLVGQLSEEYGFDLQKELDEDAEPNEEDLVLAVGGEANLEVLMAWQLEEAERSRGQVPF